MSADGGGGEGQAVVAVNGAFDAAGPGERLVGAQKDRADAEKIMGNGVFQIHTGSLLSKINASAEVEQQV